MPYCGSLFSVIYNADRPEEMIKVLGKNVASDESGDMKKSWQQLFGAWVKLIKLISQLVTCNNTEFKCSQESSNV